MAVNRSISRLTNVFLALFMLLSVGVVYWQVFKSQSLATSTYNPSLCDIGNQPVRGSIYDRNGVLLAYSQVDTKAPCNYRRYYCFPSLSPIIGYFSYIYGETGLEAAYDDILTGRQASGTDAINNFWDQTLHRPVNGADIYLTIDVRVQNMIDKQYDITYDEPGGTLGLPFYRDPKGTVGAPPNEPIPPLCQQKNGSLMQQIYNQPSEIAAHNHAGSIIVTDPHTGEILGMLSRPYFNANEIGDYIPCRLYTNDKTNANDPVCPGAQTNPPAAPASTATPTPALTSTIGAEYFKQLTQDTTYKPLTVRPFNLYLPGSTFKTMTLSAGLDSGKVQLNNPTYGGGGTACLAADSEARRYVVNGHTFQDIDIPTYGIPPACPIDVEHGYIYSDNIIYARIGVSLGADTWLNYFQRFGMIDSNAPNKQPFPFDFPVKASRVDFQAARSDNVNLAADAFGQGDLQISPLEMSFIDDTVANNGVGMLPHLLYKVVPHGASPASVGAVSPTPYSGNGVVNGQIISATTAEEVRQAMRGVVQQGSAGLIRNTQAQVGGKTGTAQLGGNVDPHSWFISLAPDVPGQMPQYTVVVMKENGDEGLLQAPVADCIYLSMFHQSNIHAGSFYPTYTCAP